MKPYDFVQNLLNDPFQTVSLAPTRVPESKIQLIHAEEDYEYAWKDSKVKDNENNGTAPGIKRFQSDVEFPALGKAKCLKTPKFKLRWADKLSWARVVYCWSFKGFEPLPLEIRQMIYHYAMDKPRVRYGRYGKFKYSRTFAHYSWKSFLQHTFIPAMCSVSKTYFIEAAPVLIRQTTFEIYTLKCVNSLIEWLAGFPEDTGFKAVRTLYLARFDVGMTFIYQSFYRHERHAHAGLALAERCTGLKNLALTFCKGLHRENDHNDNQWEIRRLTLQEIVELYELERVLELRSLRYLVLEYKFEGLRVLVSPLELVQAFCDLCDWFTKGFESRNRRVVCKVLFNEHYFRQSHDHSFESVARASNMPQYITECSWINHC
jgi:hypothetical protein